MFCVILEGSMGGSLFSFQLLLYILPIFNVFRHVFASPFASLLFSSAVCVCGGGGGWFLSEVGGSGVGRLGMGGGDLNGVGGGRVGGGELGAWVGVGWVSGGTVCRGGWGEECVESWAWVG